uniref:ATP synthase F0 subunit 8 n=1 Tax=Aoria nigripes TaxID=2954116 RepID=UPI002115875B|nr:ATP synthase F0 subunit 8 [Aoria nigripes]USM11436.1 ATP synthase F0 subunit 8 [Aoria nigripes]
MPQMAPLNWLTLYILFIIMFMLFMIQNYYSKNNFTNKLNFKKLTISTNWKW